MCNVFKFSAFNTMPQPNAYDCGVFALACATDLAQRRDPVVSEWNTEGSAMRMHLIVWKGPCFTISDKKRSGGFRSGVCRLPNHNKDLAM